ncbi:MAG: hypothetical protein AAGF89_09765, partial [Bacteroidota bacterium]
EKDAASLNLFPVNEVLLRFTGEKIQRSSIFFASRSLRDHVGQRFVTLIANNKGSNTLLITQF